MKDAHLKGMEIATRLGNYQLLAKSYLGGGRYMQERYLEAAALLRQYGPPTIFVTMTSSPQWPEVQRELRRGQKPQDRPELCARVFRGRVVSCRIHFISSVVQPLRLIR